jgi:hypothetical protein
VGKGALLRAVPTWARLRIATTLTASLHWFILCTKTT